MKKCDSLITLILLIISHNVSSQIHDQFGELNLLPDYWNGDRNTFIINTDGELQLSTAEAGSSYLSTQIPQYHENTEWRYTLRIPFSPSANNYVRFWLMADQEDLLHENRKGIFLQLGENGNADAIELRRIANKQETVICRGENGKVSTSFHLGIKVLKDENHHWKIYIDETLFGYFVLDSEETHSTDNLPYMGLSCHYTSSNSKKFFFEEIYYGTPWVDTLPAKIEYVTTQQDMQSIRIGFSKALFPGQILYNENFRIIEDNIHPIECQFSDTKYQEILIRFAYSFTEYNPKHLQINNLTDINNNSIPEHITGIIFSKIRRNDVVIHEIMADPSPAVGLPEAEYIEIHNRKSNTITLKNWKLQIGKTVRDLPEITLEGNGYALIVSSVNKPLYSELNNSHALSSLSITDGGQQIILYDNDDEAIHSVTFKSGWHREMIKRNGGWSLEMIDNGNPCHGVSNWNSSISPNGGTPGFANSIAKSNKDIVSPEIERVTLIDSLCVKLFFTEQVRIEEDVENIFQIDRGIKISRITEVPPDFQSLLIYLETPITTSKTYTLTVWGNVYDCADWKVHPNSWIQFGIPSSAQKNDLIINEIMLFSSSDGDYVEVYNRSSKIIEMGNVLLGSGGDSIPQKAVAAISGGGQLLPGNYLVICENKTTTLKQYFTPFPERLITNDSFPSYAQSGGIISLTNRELQTIDRLPYDEKMHYCLLSSINDVSLERIHFNAETANRESWKSAAASIGYGTPGYLNSQYIDWAELEDQFEITPEIISPNQDGFDDYVTIRCQFLDPENRVTISIFDPTGNPVKRLINNQYCGTEALFTWDGTSLQETCVPPGFYVILIEYWNQNGKSKKVKKVVGVR
ncbi:MAG: lamin tail domain-containing protein [Bacteroidales bacterium]|jgi:hypothetical protein|nr:lamin tail domain-containing protein [Bacteroidales bacterium]